VNAWVSIININNDVKELTSRYQNCDINDILILGGYVKVRESLYVRVVVFWVQTILNYIDIREIFARYEGSCMVYRSYWHQKQRKPHYRYPNGVK